MAKGPIVTPEIEALIASVYEKHPKWRAPRVRNEVESILYQRDKSSPRGWPSLSKVQKVLVTVRKNLENPSPEDGPWSISTMGDNPPIPPAALPTILRLWVHSKEYRGHDLSIRQAKWAARLFAFEDKMGIGPFTLCVDHYAMSERIYELAGKRLLTIYAFDAFLAFSMDPTDDSIERVRKLLSERDQEVFDNIARLLAGIPSESQDGYKLAVYEGRWPRRKRGKK